MRLAAADRCRPAGGVPPDGEPERIRQAYLRYEADPVVRRRWDPTNAGTRAIHAERRQALREMLAGEGRLPLARQRVLDVGCGSGEVLASLVDDGAEPELLHGVDLRADAIEQARRAHPEMHWQCGNAERIELPSSSFDLVLAFTVFSSILDVAMGRNLAAEIARLLRPGGALVWYDFRYASPYNANVRAMTAARVTDLFPRWPSTMRALTVLPPLARRLGGLAPVFYPLLARVTPLRSHWLGLMRRPASTGAAGQGGAEMPGER